MQAQQKQKQKDEDEDETRWQFTPRWPVGVVVRNQLIQPSAASVQRERVDREGAVEVCS